MTGDFEKNRKGGERGEDEGRGKTEKKAWKDEREERFREEKERKREREEEEGKGKAGSGLDKRELGGGKTEREKREKRESGHS